VDQFGEDEQGEGIVLGGSRYPWEGTDRDYHYEEVHFFSFVQENILGCCFVW